MLNSFVRRAARALAVPALLVLGAGPALADGGVEFARLAPPNPAFVLTIPDFAKMHAAFEACELGKLWEEPGVQSFVEELTTDASKRITDFLTELGAETKDLKPPTGAVGVAIYVSDPKETDKKNPPAPMALISADAGENAQSWKDLIERLLDKATKDKSLTSDDDTYSGVKVTTLRPIYQDSPAAAPKPEDGNEDDDAPPEPRQSGFAGFLGGSKDHPQALHLAWKDSVLLASTSLPTLQQAIDALQGKEGENLASDPDFKAAVSQHPSDTQVAAYLNVSQVLSTALEEAMGKRAARDDGEQFKKIMAVLGVSQVKYVGFGFRMGTGDATAESSLGILAPDKKGILKLVSEPLGTFDPSAFVSPDAASVTRVSFRFDKVYDLLREVAAALPEEDGKQMSAGLDQGVNLVKPGLDALGPGVDIVGTYRQPLAVDSQMNLVAIEVKDQETVSNTLAFFATQAQGMAESREFEGNTIYTIERMKLSVGLGFHRLFIGQTPAVENAMRLSGRADAPRISAEAGFKEATQGFGTDSVMQSFSDTSQSVRWTYWTLQNAEKIAETQIDAAGLEPEQKERILKGLRERQPKWLDKLPPLELVLRHLGDSASEMHPTPDGFRGRTLLLKPAPK